MLGVLRPLLPELADALPGAVTGPITARSGAGNGVTGQVRMTGNTTGEVPIVVAGNRITGTLQCTGNEPPPVNDGELNSVQGTRSGQCTDL